MNETIRKYNEIPQAGVELASPLSGWRVEPIPDDSGFASADREGILRAEMCTRTPKTSGIRILGFTSPLAPTRHRAPHPHCQCGIRLVEQLRQLSHYWEPVHEFMAASGVSRGFGAGTDLFCVVRAEASGFVTPGHDMPDDDPWWTMRAGEAVIREIFHPEWVHGDALAETYPAAEVRPIEELPGDGFAWLRAPDPPRSTIRMEASEKGIRIWVPGRWDIDIPTSYITWERVREALVELAHSGWASQQPLLKLAETIVYPLSDLEDADEAFAAAYGIGIVLHRLHALPTPEEVP